MPSRLSAVEVRVRRADSGDADRLSLLGRATFLETYASLLPVDDILQHVAVHHAPQVYERWFADARCAIWIAEVLPGCAPVGYLVATPPDLPLPDADAQDLEIRRIYLLHAFHGGGYGSALMEAVVAAARQMHKRRLLLGVYSRNERALRFYEDKGFTRAGTRQFRVGAHEYFDYVLQRAP